MRLKRPSWTLTTPNSPPNTTKPCPPDGSDTQSAATAVPKQKAPSAKLTMQPGNRDQKFDLWARRFGPHLRHTAKEKQRDLADRNAVTLRDVGMSQLVQEHGEEQQCGHRTHPQYRESERPGKAPGR